MATDLPTAKFEALATLTGVRTDIADMEWRWLASLVFPRTGTLDDMWAWALADDGYRDKYDMLQQVLGYKSDINTMWLDYWTNQPGAGIGAPAWTYSGAALDIDFMNDQSWFAGVEGDIFSRLTFTRSTTGTYYDASGILQTAAINTPRIDYDPTTLAKRGFLSEQAATNYCLYSNDFSQAAWNKTNITLTAGATTGPDGLMSMSKIEATASAATQVVQTCSGAGAAAGNTYSIYVKKGSGATDANSFVLRNNTTATNLVTVTFNYDTGVFSGADAAKAFAQQLPNGIWRISLISTTGINANDNLGVYVCFIGSVETAGEFAYVYGAQTERPIGATSYFPTTSSAITRATDNLHIDTSSFSFNVAEGTLLSRFRTDQQMTTGGSSNSPCGFHVAGDGANTERLQLFNYAATPATNRMGTYGRTSDIQQWDMTISQTQFAFGKVGVTWRENDISVSLNGSAVTTDTSATIPTVNRLALGRGLHNTQYLNGHVDRVTYWPTHKTNTELASLTT